MKSRKLNFAIIGCGSVSIDHAKAIKKLGHNISYGSTKKINSKNWKLFKKKFPQTEFATINEILNNNNIDRVISCLPLNEQKKYCKKILTSNKPILIEKPLHDNALKLKKIFAVKDSCLFNKAVAYNRRNYDVVSDLKKKIKSKKLKSVDVNISENSKYLKKKYGKNFKKVFLHVGSSSHIIDLLCYLFGNLKVLKTWKTNLSMSIVFVTKKKIPIFVNINPSDAENPSLKVRFIDNDMWQLSPIESLKIFKGNKTIKSNENFFKKKIVPNLLIIKSEKKTMRPGFYNQMKYFASNDFKNLCSVKDNYNLIKIFNQIS